MKKYFFSLFAILAIPFISFEQSRLCGYDHFIEQIFENPDQKANFDAVQETVQEKIDGLSDSRSILQPNNYIIPVVFHVVGSDGIQSGAITNQQILDQLQILNDGFANLMNSPYAISDDAQITFCLAQNTPDGTSWSSLNNSAHPDLNGVTRHVNGVAQGVSNGHNMEVSSNNGQQELGDIIYFDPTRYLNIWIVNSISSLEVGGIPVLGYSSYPLSSYLGFPSYLDGIIMRHDVFGMNSGHANYNQGRTIIHEAGHYLGLFHTFMLSVPGGDGCDEISNSLPCNASGDYCCDTPPAESANQNDCTALIGTNSCPGPELDMIENHMDYAYDNLNTCRNTFTDDQADRMHGVIQALRPNLVSYSNLLITGVMCLPPGLNPDFVTDLPNGSTQGCTGQSIGFLSAFGASSYTWDFDGATFPPGEDMVQNPTGVVWNSPGIYTVELIVDDGSGNTFQSTLQVFITSCNPISGANSHWYFGNLGELDFTSGTPVSMPNSGMYTLEASASVSNSSGNLELYTNGRLIWNEAHWPINTPPNEQMNGSANFPSQSNNMQGVVIVPKPGSPNYLIYPTSDGPQNNISNGISEYEYDPVGDQLLSFIPHHPAENYAMTEPIIAIPACDGLNYWLVTKPTTNDPSNLYSLPNPGSVSNINNFITSYLVTAAGVSDTPVLSESGNYVPPATWGVFNDWIGSSAVSPNKKLIAFNDYLSQECHLYYFNCDNGKLEFITTVQGGVGTEFSPDSKKLYTTFGSGVNHKIRQYDLTDLSFCNDNPPYVDFNFNVPGNSSTPLALNALQLGPDDKIYINHAAGNSNPIHDLGVINFPDNINTTSSSNECGYNYFGVNLLTNQQGKSNLPNDIIGFNGANSPDFSYCSDNCLDVCFTNLGCGTAFTWDFGDGYSVSGVNGEIPTLIQTQENTVGNFEYPCHTYASEGTYTVTFTIDGHPPIQHIIEITAPSIPIISGPTQVCANTSIPITYWASPTGYDYEWNVTNGNPSYYSGVNPFLEIVWQNNPGTINLTIIDQNTGCSNSASVGVVVFPAPVVDAGIDQNVCSGDNVLLSGAGADSYIWNNGVIDGVPFTPTNTDVYTVTGTDINGCQGTDQVTVTVSSPTVDAGMDQTICATESVTLTGSGNAISYTWNNGVTDGIPFFPTTTTTYTVTGTDLNGCEATDQVTVTVNPLPTVTANIDQPGPYCEGDQITLTGGGALNYTWDNGVTDGVPFTPSVGTNTYTVTGTDANGCINTDQITITVNPAPHVTANANPSVICPGSEVILTAGGALTYVWDQGLGAGSSHVVMPTSTTTYTVTGTDINGCTATTSVTVTVNPNPVVVASADVTICEGEMTTISASGANSYEWFPGSLIGQNQTVNPTVTTTYLVIGTDVNGCTASDEVIVTVNSLPTVTANVDQAAPYCVGDVITLFGSGAVSYAWDNGITDGVPIIPPAGTVTYTVTGTDGNGCENTDDITITVNPTPTVVANIAPFEPPLCPGDLITLFGSGTADIYTWDNSVDDNGQFPITSTTTFTVTGTLNGCSSTDQITVNVTPLPTVVAFSDASYCPYSDQPVQLNALLGIGVNAVSWSPPLGLSCTNCANPLATPNSTTTYTVNASGFCGKAQDQVTITIDCVCDECDPLTLDGNLNVDPAPDMVYCANNTTVNGNIKITGCEIKMEPYATILVTSGAKLTIEGCHIYSCSKEMWKGIVVEPGGQLVITSNNIYNPDTPQVQIISSLIEDAFTAVDILANSPLTNGIMTVNNTIFNRNDIGIRINGYNQQLTSYPFKVNRTMFTCRDIPFNPGSLVWPQFGDVSFYNFSAGDLAAPWIDDQLFSQHNAQAFLKAPSLPNSKSFAGIYLNEVGEVDGEETISPTWYEIWLGDVGNLNVNIYDNQQFGIHSVNSNFTVVNSVFQYTIDGTKYGGTGVYGRASSTNHRARLMPAHPSGAWTNYFFDCHYGILTQEYFENEFTQCEFRSTQIKPSSPVPVIPFHQGSYGIFIRTNRWSNVEVSENLLWNIDNGILFFANHGPYDIGGVHQSLDGQYSGQITISNNELEAHYQSNLTQFMSTGISVQNNSPELIGFHDVPNTSISVVTNTVKDVFRGEFITNWQDKKIACNYNKIRLAEDDVSFNATPTQYGIAVKNCNSLSAVSNNSVQGFGIIGNDNVRSIWLSVSTGFTVSCNDTKFTDRGIEFTGYCTPAFFTRNIMKSHAMGYVLDVNGILGTQGNSVSPVDNRWQGNWNFATHYKTACLNGSNAQLSKMWVRNNPQQYNPDNSAFPSGSIYDDQNGSILYATPPQFGKLCPKVINVKLSDPSILDIVHKIASDQMVYEVFPEETKYINKARLFYFIENNPELLEDDILNEFYFKNKGSDFDPPLSIEENNRVFYEFYKVSNSKEITEEDAERLYQLASGCPYSDGEIVIYARALYNAIFFTNIHFEDNCNPKGKGSVSLNEPMEIVDDFSIYPNPTLGEFTIVPDAYTSSVVITLRDLGGKEIFSGELQDESGMFKLDLELESGVYMVEITNLETQTSAVKKLIVN